MKMLVLSDHGDPDLF